MKKKQDIGKAAMHNMLLVKKILINANGSEKLSRKLAESCIGRLGDLIGLKEPVEKTAKNNSR